MAEGLLKGLVELKAAQEALLDLTAGHTGPPVAVLCRSTQAHSWLYDESLSENGKGGFGQQVAQDTLRTQSKLFW